MPSGGLLVSMLILLIPMVDKIWNFLIRTLPVHPPGEVRLSDIYDYCFPIINILKLITPNIKTPNLVTSLRVFTIIWLQQPC